MLLLSILTALDDALGAMLKDGRELYLYNLSFLGDALTEACELALAQVKALIPIMSGYARFQQPTAADLPIDPTLPGWLARVHTMVSRSPNSR